MAIKLEPVIQERHDFLHAIVAGDIDLGLTDEDIEKAHGALDALCWVLGHKGATEVFDENIRLLEEEAKRRGYTRKENLFQ